MMPCTWDYKYYMHCLQKHFKPLNTMKMAITIIICKFHKDNKSQDCLNFFLIVVEVIKSVS